MNRVIIFFLVFVCMASCKKEQTQNGQMSSLLFSEEHATKTAGITERFTEGKIDVEIYFPGNRLSEILKKVDPSKGDTQQQMEEFVKEISPEEREKISRITQGNPVLALQIMFAPMLKNEIFVKENRVTAKCDGMMYHLENTLNADTETGMIFVRSQSDQKKQVTFKYDKDFFKENQFQTKIDLQAYDRKPTGETALIAGYPCRKALYTLKGGNNNAVRIGKLEVWTSEYVPKSLNFIHPYYLEEAHGIMKIAIYQGTESEVPMIYEFKKLTPSTVSNSDMEIRKSEPVYESSDMMEIGSKLMGIMFGG